jgi:hypothetical protein
VAKSCQQSCGDGEAKIGFQNKKDCQDLSIQDPREKIFRKMTMTFRKDFTSENFLYPKSLGNGGKQRTSYNKNKQTNPTVFKG